MEARRITHWGDISVVVVYFVLVLLVGIWVNKLLKFVASFNNFDKGRCIFKNVQNTF